MQASSASRASSSSSSAYQAPVVGARANPGLAQTSSLSSRDFEEPLPISNLKRKSLPNKNEGYGENEEWHRAAMKCQSRERIRLEKYSKDREAACAFLSGSPSMPQVQVAFQGVLEASASYHQAEVPPPAALAKVLTEENISDVAHLIHFGGGFVESEVGSLLVRIPWDKLPACFKDKDEKSTFDNDSFDGLELESLSEAEEDSDSPLTDYLVRYVNVPKEAIKRVGERYPTALTWSEATVKSMKNHETKCLPYSGTGFSNRLDIHAKNTEKSLRQKVAAILKDFNVGAEAYRFTIPNGSTSSSDWINELSSQQNEIIIVSLADGPLSLNSTGGGHCRNITLNPVQEQWTSDIASAEVEFDRNNSLTPVSIPASTPIEVRNKVKKLRYLNYKAIQFIHDHSSIPGHPIPFVISPSVVEAGFEAEQESRSLADALLCSELPLEAAKDTTGTKGLHQSFPGPSAEKLHYNIGKSDPELKAQVLGGEAKAGRGGEKTPASPSLRYGFPWNKEKVKTDYCWATVGCESMTINTTSLIMLMITSGMKTLAVQSSQLCSIFYGPDLHHTWNAILESGRFSDLGNENATVPNYVESLAQVVSASDKLNPDLRNEWSKAQQDDWRNIASTTHRIQLKLRDGTVVLDATVHFHFDTGLSQYSSGSRLTIGALTFCQHLTSRVLRRLHSIPPEQRRSKLAEILKTSGVDVVVEQLREQLEEEQLYIYGNGDKKKSTSPQNRSDDPIKRYRGAHPLGEPESEERKKEFSRMLALIELYGTDIAGVPQLPCPESIKSKPLLVKGFYMSAPKDQSFEATVAAWNAARKRATERPPQKRKKVDPPPLTKTNASRSAADLMSRLFNVYAAPTPKWLELVTHTDCLIIFWHTNAWNPKHPCEIEGKKKKTFKVADLDLIRFPLFTPEQVVESKEMDPSEFVALNGEDYEEVLAIDLLESLDSPEWNQLFRQHSSEIQALAEVESVIIPKEASFRIASMLFGFWLAKDRSENISEEQEKETRAIFGGLYGPHAKGKAAQFVKDLVEDIKVQGKTPIYIYKCDRSVGVCDYRRITVGEKDELPSHKSTSSLSSNQRPFLPNTMNNISYISPPNQESELDYHPQALHPGQVSEFVEE